MRKKTFFANLSNDAIFRRKDSSYIWVAAHCQAECKQVFQWQKGLSSWAVLDIQIDLAYKNQNVRGCKALKKGQSLILYTVRNVSMPFYATSYIVSVDRLFHPCTKLYANTIFGCNLLE